MSKWGFATAVACAAACAFVFLFSSQYRIAADTIDDEPMARARELRLRPSDAADRWFYPKYIHNYFAGMDEVAAVPDGKAYQLLDLEAFSPKAVQPAMQPADPVTTDAEILGRNTWMMWAAGNEGFWDWLSRQYGFLDFLKVTDSNDRGSRFAASGLINEPGMEATPAGEMTVEQELGLRLDRPSDEKVHKWRQEYLRMVFAMDGKDAGKPTGSYSSSYTAGGAAFALPGSAAKSYDTSIPPPEIYGLSSGIIGLRLFPNPKFDATARKRWLAAQKSYYATAPINPRLERPFRVGMSCAFCHASFHPLNPPDDTANPDWKNISGNIGAQYLRVSKSFSNLLPKDNFIYHILDSQPPGTVDTSLVASDNINNPNTMNSVFNLAQRALVSFFNPSERQALPAAQLPSLWKNPTGDPNGDPDRPNLPLEALAKKYWSAQHLKGQAPPFPSEVLTKLLADSNGADRRVPHILFDGADSIGAWGALARVYLNIGTNWEQWNTLHDPVLGLSKQKPFTIANTKEHSVYWQATERRVGPLRDYFLKISPQMPLIAARDVTYRASEERASPRAARVRGRSIDIDQLKDGRRVFAENCIACHSSVQPLERQREMQKLADSGKYFEDNPFKWMDEKNYREWAHDAVERPEFWEANYLSTDYRIPVDVIGTNSCRAMATNAIAGNMWEDFSSDSYKALPARARISAPNPYADPRQQPPPAYAPRHKGSSGGGGTGYYRVPTLVSIWATAPFLHNNSVGKFTGDPRVDGRLDAFDDAIRRLLWRDKRLLEATENDGKTLINEATTKRRRADGGLIWRTPNETKLVIAGSYLPDILGAKLPWLRDFRKRYPELSFVPPVWRPVPTIGLFLIGFVILVRARRRWLQTVGYGAIVAGLAAGALIYFLNGALGGLSVGPIPANTPVGLIANFNPEADPDEVKGALADLRDALIEIKSTGADEKAITEILKKKAAPALLRVSKCPDLVMDRGHYWARFDNISERDKNALVELLKTF